ncbi:hypothetical protein QLX08_011496 [Tetragonisca angustula]|uniref:Uncharacterized protein n=1 Tax=Tetragonisca angustula TaxID=166442 RepID=A0AAW0Z7T0_9HYME
MTAPTCHFVSSGRIESTNLVERFLATERATKVSLANKERETPLLGLPFRFAGDQRQEESPVSEAKCLACCRLACTSSPISYDRSWREFIDVESSLAVRATGLWRE